MRKVFLVLLMLLCFAAPSLAADCTNHYLSLTHITDGNPFMGSVEADPTSDYVYANYFGKMYYSDDNGETWVFSGAQDVTTWSTTIDTPIFVSSQGTIFCSDDGYLQRIVRSAGPAFTVYQEQQFEDTVDGRFWYMDESPNNILYMGEYSGTLSDEHANVWRSTDDGDTWTLIYDGDTDKHRHVHNVAVDEHHSTTGQYHVYISCGDGAGEQDIYKCTNPEDGSPVWNSIYSSDCWGQPITIICTPNYRVFGSDCGDSEGNAIYRTTDDSNFTEELTLGDKEFVWSMTEDQRGIIYAGIVRGPTEESQHIAIYVSYDEGDTWCELYTVGDWAEEASYWKGVEWFSRNWTQDSDGDYWGFVVINDASDNYKSEAYRIYSHSRWNIDDDADKDFDDILTAIADEQVGRRDTLAIYPGSYAQNGIIPYTDMTIKGATGNPHDAIIWTDGTDTDIIVCSADTSGIKLRNFEIRGQHTFTGSIAGINIEAGNTDTYIDGVWFKKLSGIYNSAINVNDGASLRLHSARIESCSTAGAGKYGAIQAQYVIDVIIEESIVAKNTADRSAVFILHQNDGSADTTNILSCLFDQNEATVSDGAALMIQMNSTATQRPRLEHLTFYKNTSATAIDGQLKTGGNRTDEQIDYCVFYGDGTTYANFNDVAYMTNANYCTAFNNGNSDVITAANKTDCIDVDPNFTNLNRYSTIGFRAKSLDDAGSGSSPRFTQDGSYMGWKQYIDIGGWHSNGYYKIRRRLFFF